MRVLASLRRSVPRALVVVVAAHLLDVAVDVAVFLVLTVSGFASYLVVLLLVELLLAVFAVAPRLSAVRRLAAVAPASDPLRTVRVAASVRRLWRRVERGVLLGGVIVLLGVVSFADFGIAAAGAVVFALALFALRGGVESGAGLLAGALRPLAALGVSAVVPPAVVLVLLAASLAVGLNVPPAAVFGTHLAGAAVALAALRSLLVLERPAAALDPRLVDSSPGSPGVLAVWTAASLAERSVTVVPLLVVLVVVEPAASVAYAMAWRVSAIVDAVLMVHVLVRPAVAAALAGGVSARSGVVVGRLFPVTSAVLWWTLVAALLAAGPVVALDRFLALFFGVPSDLFSALLRLFVAGRLLVVSAGPGAELLAVGGCHLQRFRIAVGSAAAALPAAALLAVAGRVHQVAVVVVLARLVLEVAQSSVAYLRMRVDCSVVGVLRAPDPNVQRASPCGVVTPRCIARSTCRYGASTLVPRLAVRTSRRVFPSAVSEVMRAVLRIGFVPAVCVPFVHGVASVGGVVPPPVSNLAAVAWIVLVSAVARRTGRLGQVA